MKVRIFDEMETRLALIWNLDMTFDLSRIFFFFDENQVSVDLERRLTYISLFVANYLLR